MSLPTSDAEIFGSCAPHLFGRLGGVVDPATLFGLLTAFYTIGKFAFPYVYPPLKSWLS